MNRKTVIFSDACCANEELAAALRDLECKGKVDLLLHPNSEENI